MLYSKNSKLNRLFAMVICTVIHEVYLFSFYSKNADVFFIK